MTSTTSKLTWCKARIGEDMNWWIQEISDPIHWDIDGLGIIDPRQFQHILEHENRLLGMGNVLKVLPLQKCQENLLDKTWHEFDKKDLINIFEIDESISILEIFLIQTHKKLYLKANLY